ncbi:unnamed protein product [Plutella xylostella]|uniref:(diamondback moth) hypothetical protein n=1 Tax=Plutella xylostella TaxID=51655 RepID=A0A8S4EN52_PLUXY|nr:unnamed protein product [Plutella xylostella]
MMFSTTSAFIIMTLAATATALKDGGVYVIGGEQSSVEEYPSIVQMYLLLTNGDLRFTCGAVIFSKRTVISAAHCMDGDVKPCNIRIRAGSSRIWKDGHIVRVRNYQIHPDYDAKNLNANIALLTLRTRLPLSNVIQPAFIVPSGLGLPENHAVQVAGWAMANSLVYAVLQKATVYTINHDECSRRFVAAGYPGLTEDMICAGTLDVGGRYLCKSDSGGPLYMDGMLVGIVSKQLKNCTEFPFGKYTKVSAYTNWIKSNAD